jgi:hypothetical protein
MFINKNTDIKKMMADKVSPMEGAHLTLNDKGEVGYWQTTTKATNPFTMLFGGGNDVKGKTSRQWIPFGGALAQSNQGQISQRDTSRDPSWWNTGGGMSGGQTPAPAPVPRPAPVNPSSGSQPANPMIQMLGNRGGKTVTGPQQALATALRGGGNG